MRRMLAVAALSIIVLAGCSASDDDGASTLPIADADEVLASTSDELPDTIALGDPDDSDEPLQVTFGGFFFSDGEAIQLCSSLAESFPPQCGSVVIDIEAPLDLALAQVADSFDNPDDARINIDQGVYWTDEWINLSGQLAANRLVLQ